MLIYRITNFVLAPTLYLLDWHQRRDIRPSRPYVSPHTDLCRSIGVPCRALEAHKNSVGRRTRIIIIIGSGYWSGSQLSKSNIKSTLTLMLI